MTEDLETGAEFSRIIECSSLGHSSEGHSIEADEGERAALADRLGLLGLDELTAEIDLVRTSDGLIRMRAKLRARVAQNCVVALQAVQQELEEEFELFFKENAMLDGTGTLELTLEDQHWPEPLEQDRIDIGEEVSQQLALALDPYPRASGAVFKADEEPEIMTEPRKPLAEIGNLIEFGEKKSGH